MKKKWEKEYKSRRGFIKKGVLGGLFIASGWPLIASIKSSVSIKKTSSLKFSDVDYSSINWAIIRDEFPITRERKYFNVGSLGPSPQVVIDKICNKTELFERMGSDGHSKKHVTRNKYARFFNVQPEEITFTRNATEGMNIAARSLPLKAGDEILLTNHEHIGGGAPWLALRKDIGITIRLIELDMSGENNLQLIKDSIGPKTKVISFSHVTCTTGMLLPAKEIAELCKENNIFCCIDGAQSAGLIPIDLNDINPDMYACSGHKWLYGPSGTGILFINKAVIEKCSPNHVGAYSDKKYDLASMTLEYNMTASREEYGTRNSPLIYGLESALDFIHEIGFEHIVKRRKELVDYFLSAIDNMNDIKVLSPKNRDYGTPMISIQIKGVDSAKSTISLHGNQQIRVRGIYENDLNAFRISFSIFNTKSEIDYLVESLLALK